MVIFCSFWNPRQLVLDDFVKNFNRFGNACVSQFPTPRRSLTQNTWSQISESAKDLLESSRNLLGSARSLPRISWSTIASSHLPHIHWPRNDSQVKSQTAWPGTETYHSQVFFSIVSVLHVDQEAMCLHYVASKDFTAA